MNKKNGNSENKYTFKHSYENSFISDVIKAYNAYLDVDIENQRNAIRNVIRYIKIEKENGTSLEDIEDMILYNMSNIFERIKYPTLTNFYQLRTLECMLNIDLTPYLEKILNSGIDLEEYERKNRNSYSANINKNIFIELCSMINDFFEENIYTTNTGFNTLKTKIKSKKLTIDDLDLVKKYVLLYLKELEIGKAAYWEKTKKNPEACRKLLIKFRNSIFDVKTINTNMKGVEHNTEASIIPCDVKNKLSEIKSSVNREISLINKGKVSETCQKITLKEFCGEPFIGNDDNANFIIIMFEVLRKFGDAGIEGIYKALIASEYSTDINVKQRSKTIMDDFFCRIGIKKNVFYVREHLLERLSVLMSFYSATGSLEQFCNINNNRLKKINLEDLQIDLGTFYEKFSRNPEMASQYFFDQYADYENC